MIRKKILTEKDYEYIQSTFEMEYHKDIEKAYEEYKEAPEYECTLSGLTFKVYLEESEESWEKDLTFEEFKKQYKKYLKKLSRNFKNCLNKFNLPLTFAKYKMRIQEEPILLINEYSFFFRITHDSNDWKYLLENDCHNEDKSWEKIFLFLFKEYLYQVEGAYTWEEAKLLVFEDYDKERKKLERLKLLYDSEEVKEDSKSRSLIPEEVKIAVWRRDSARCVKCGSQENLEYDHIIPVSKGGSNTARNIQILCERCNRQKKDNIA
jgi:hypothetical protein